MPGCFIVSVRRWASLVQSGVVPQSFLEIDAQCEHLCGNQPVRWVPKSFLGDDAAVLAPSSGEEGIATPSSRRRVDEVEVVTNAL